MTDRLISPDVIRGDMQRVQKACTALDQLARVVTASYAELYDASLSKVGYGNESNGNRRGLPLGDPTGETAISGLHKRMRWHVRDAGRVLRRLRPILEEAEDILVEAFKETDPEFREKLRRLRELEAAAEQA